MKSSRLWLSLPRFLWRGRGFWGAWLLVFLLPWTHSEARLHFIGSRFFPRLYDLPWQERWMAPENEPTPALTPLERAMWTRIRSREGGFSPDYSGNLTNPASTSAGHLLRDFPREEWLRALALRQSLGWGTFTGRNASKQQNAFWKWAHTGERLEPKNAFFPLMLAKTLGDAGRGSARDAALERAAKCTLFDDGTSRFKQVALSAARGAGVQTWSEEWSVWTQTENNWSDSSNQLQELLGRCVAQSQAEMTTARKAKSPLHLRAALKRSNALMRVSLLLQSAPCDSKMWRVGADFARGAWQIGASTPASRWAFNAKVATFIAFANKHNSAPNARLAQKCAARIRLLKPFVDINTGPNSSPMFSSFEMVWAEASGPIGFGFLFFAANLLGWWWLISLFLWRATGRESKRSSRVVPALFVISATLLSFGALTMLMMTWMNSPTLARRGPPVGQLEVTAAWGLFAFFSPPLLLALWCAVRTRRQNRAALALPARQQIEMNLAPFDAFFLSRALGTFALAFIGLCVGCSVLWGVLRWNGMTGYDWLRAMFPGIPTRVVNPAFTSFDSPATPTYAALAVIVLTFVWFISWRYATDPARRPVFHDGIRAWKEALGCTLCLSVWVYLAFLLTCHISGAAFSKRLDVVATRGEGAFVKGF